MSNYAVILGNLGNTCDRFLSTGYKDVVPTAEMIEQAAKIADVTGIELVGTWDISPDNFQEVKSCLQANGLECVSIIPDLFSQKQWGRGSIAAKDSSTRAAAMDYLRTMAEIALDLGCPMLNIWPGQDGYDYPLQADMIKERDYMTDNITILAKEFPNLKFSLEYKPKEPRNHSFMARAADTLLVALDTGLDNVGVTIDVGHALYAGENVAESIVILARKQKLFHMHFNDNYRYWDDDMIVGSIHLPEYVEMLYWLQKVGYSSWYSMDQYPYREDGKRALETSVQFLKGIESWLDSAAMAEITEIIQSGDAVSATSWVHRKIFG